MKPKYAIGELPAWDAQWGQIIKDLAISFEAAAGEGTTYWDQHNRILYVLRCPSYRHYIAQNHPKTKLEDFQITHFKFNDTYADRLLTCTRGWYKDGAYMTSVNLLGNKTLNHLYQPQGKIFPDQLDKLIVDNVKSNEMYETIKTTKALHKTNTANVWLTKQQLPVTDPFFGLFDPKWEDVRYSEVSPAEQVIINSKKAAAEADGAYAATAARYNIPVRYPR